MKSSTRDSQLPASAAPHLLEMARLAEQQLAAEVGVINALNVFPVPDGDTGSNMLATVRAALARVEDGTDVISLVEQLSNGALLGARGNSGVILSQLFKAQAEVLAGCPVTGPLEPSQLAAILVKASQLARAVVTNPVEGTMLSVFDAAAGVQSQPDLTTMLRCLLDLSEAAVAATPAQLAILQEAQVVDSGGYGLLTVFRGWYEALVGQPPPPISRDLLGLARAREQVVAGSAHPADLVGRHLTSYGHCMTLLVDSPSVAEALVRQRLSDLGDSVLVVASGAYLKLHVHAPETQPVLDYAHGLGRIVDSEISNIDEQTASPAPSLPIVAVASGEGLAQVFRGLGAAVVAGGAGQNPSTADLLRATAGLPGPVFLLPNNRNILSAARQAAALRSGQLVLPILSIPAGIAAVLAFDPAASEDENSSRMTRAAELVVSAEILPAARAAIVGGVSVQAGQSMVLLEGELLGTDDVGVDALASRVAHRDPGLVTIYYGAGGTREAAGRLGARLQATLPEIEVEIVRGDQSHAAYILGFE